MVIIGWASSDLITVFYDFISLLIYYRHAIVQKFWPTISESIESHFNILKTDKSYHCGKIDRTKNG